MWRWWLTYAQPNDAAAGMTDLGTQVVLWDLRGGRGGAQQLRAQGPSCHPVLKSISISQALRVNAELMAQTRVDHSAPCQLAPCPQLPHRLAFRTLRGWSGAICQCFCLAPPHVPWIPRGKKEKKEKKGKCTGKTHRCGRPTHVARFTLARTALLGRHSR